MKTADALVNGASANVPSEDLNGPQIAAGVDVHQKYDEERDKRLRDEGLAQYIDPTTSEKHRHFLEDPWVSAGTPINRPVPNGGHSRFLIVGAGFGGILHAVKLIKAGYSADELLMVDPAGGFGGTWYWNRYPGLMCDVESYIYMPLLEEMGYMPKHKYSAGEELRNYAESICRKFDLSRRSMFQSSVKDIKWVDNQWMTVITEKPKGGKQTDIALSVDHVMFATGTLSNAKLPDIAGFDSFAGKSFHTARWDYECTGGNPQEPALTGLEGKRVALIGTGATAVQVVPQLGKWAKELYVFQRTPSAVDRRDNRETDPGWWKSMTAEQGWQKERNVNFNAFLNNTDPKPEINLVDDQWTHLPTFSALIGGPKKVTMENVQVHVGDLRALDYPRAERVRKRAQETVTDVATAKKLQAWYPSWCKRPCFHDEYLPAFNAPNVHLVDTEGKGVDRITEHGVVAAGGEYDVDVIIFGTGYASPFLGTSAGKGRINVTGRDGQVLEERSNKGELSTLHGIIARDFPNMFWPGPLQGATTANQTFVLDMMTEHIAYVVSTAAQRAGSGSRPIIEPSAEAQEQWANVIMSRAAALAGMAGCTPGYFNMEGLADKLPPEVQMKAARNTIWGGGMAAFTQILEDWRAEGSLYGLEVTTVAE